ncbi:MAG TPA: hypothetical protein VFV99_01410 [Kofleriaceae bacterium]|nr:hypothetical protein [Kofleriaceae bacterium]
MRNFLLVILVGASACAARSSNQPTLPVHYACGEATVTRNGIEMRSSATPGEISRLSWHDDKGEHFVTWPLSPTDRTATEFVVPSDPRQDATQRTYDTTFGSSTADWRLTDKQVCTARGGYNDLLARYMRGESIDDLTRDVGLSSREETRAVIRKALVSLQKKYWSE